MTPVTCMAGRKLALFGLGGSGVATALALKAGGADVLAFDDNAASLEKARAQGIATADLREADWSGFAALVLAPGVPLTHPKPHWTVVLAKAAGVEIIGDIELFCRERNAVAPGSPFVAITGTNGKSTTTALVAHILRTAGRDVQMGGNIGTAILSLDPPSRDRVHVIEMSSFQIDLTPSFGRPSQAPHAEVAGAAGPRSTQRGGASFEAPGLSPGAPQDEEPGVAATGSVGPTVGVLLNITPDHLDRHGTMENYAAIKERVVAGAEAALINIDDKLCWEIGERLSHLDDGRDVYPVSASRQLDWGTFVFGSRILDKGANQDITEALELADLNGVKSLRGQHNAENAAFACQAAYLCWVEPEDIAKAVRTFPGLPHRMEEIARRGSAIFVNDSKATNADSAEKALLSFDRVLWILGGVPKEGGIEPLRPLFTKIDKAYLIGEATEAFAVTLGAEVSFERCGTLDRAVAAAAEEAARSGARQPVVLLSPACASYDQYRNFKIRGDHFRDLVRALPGIEMRS